MNQAKVKKEILDFLADSPYVNLACKKVGISRATYYRWRVKDKKFRGEVEIAIGNGRDTFREIAESMLLKKVKEGNLDAIKYALQHNDKRYEPIKPMPPKFDIDDMTDPVARSIWKAYGDHLRETMDAIEMMRPKPPPPTSDPSGNPSG